MAQTIKLKRSATPGAIPSLESLELGEIAINTNDGKVYIKKDDGTSPDTIIEVTGAGGLASGDLNFLDNEKAIFGTDSDLQIYHTGTNSYIDDSGTGNLNLRSNGSFIKLDTISGETMLSAKTDGAVTLYYDNAVKLATTVSGIDVTGTVTADGLSVATGTDAIINGINGEGLQFQRNGAAQIRIDSVNDDGGVYHAPAGKNHTFKTDGVNRVKFATGGDVQFFEDTGTTPKFYWDASAEALRVGSTSAIFTNSVISGVSALGPTIGAKQTTAAQYAGGFWNADTGAVNLLSFYAGSGGTQIGSIAGTSTGVSLFGSGGNGLTVNSSGNVGIGTDSPAAKLHIENGDMRIEKDTKATIGFRAHTTGSTALAFRDSSAAIDRMTIDASGNVGISTSSPPEGFAIGATSSVAGFSIGSGDTQVFLRYNNYFSGTAQVSDATKGSASLSLGRGSDGVITFNTAAAGAGAPSEAARIDASGNLLVSKTTPSSATAGHELLDYGRAIHTANATTVQIVNRLGNDGDISIFQKDGTTAGSIGNVGSIMYIGKSDTTIAFDETSDSVKPRGTAGAQRDGAINLGTAGNRWKDLYLSGQILSADGTAGAPAYAFGNDTDMGMYRAANNNLGFSSNGAERMRIDASGNVGINQADPQTKTHITAAGSGSGVTDVLTIQTTRSDVGTAFAGGAINFVNNDTNSAGQARIKVGSSNDVATIGLNSESAQSFIFETSTSGSATTSNIDGNATTITVTHETYSGFVPGQRIAINTGTYQGGYFIDTVTSDTEFTIADTDHDLAADSSGTPTIQYAVPRDSMIIRADGDVGIGTNSPAAKLDVKSQLNMTNSDNGSLLGLKATRFGYSSAYKVLQIGSGAATTSDNLAIGVDLSTNASGSFTGYGEAIYFRNNVTFRTPNSANDGFHTYTTMKDGNVVGTTSPSSTLDLTNGTDTAERAIRIQNDTVVLLTGVEGSAGNRFVGSAVGNAFFGTTSAHGLEFGTIIMFDDHTRGNVRYWLQRISQIYRQISGTAKAFRYLLRIAATNTLALASTTVQALFFAMDFDSTNQIYDFISNQGVGLSIVDLTASITPLAFAHTTGNATFAGDVTVTGDLFVTGATTSVNVEDLNVEQGEITLNFGAGDTSAAANGAGIRIQDAVDASTDATILWNATSDKFEFSHGIISAGPITGSNLSGTNTGDETQSSINALGITEVGTITTGTWNGDIIAEAYLQNQSGTNTGDEPAASTTVAGIVELATTAETTTGTDATRAVTPDGLKDGYQGSSNVTTLGTIATGTWNGDIIAEAYLQNQSGTNTGDETQASINALGITEVGTIATGTWNGDIIAEAYLQNQSGTNTGDETQSSINALGITEVGTITTGVWNGDIIAEAYLQNQSGTNTGDETQSSINALGITEVGTIATGVWNGDIIAEAYLQNQSGTNTGDEPAASTTVAGIVELATTAETTTGTDATRAVTPDGLKDGYQGSSNVTTLGTIATGTWNGDIIAEAYLQNQSGTNTGDETQASINALGITEVGTIATGTWNGDIIAEAYLQNQSGTNTGDETQSSINALGITEVGTITTGVWNGDIIAEAYLQNQSGTNTGDETQASINALGITEVGTIATGVWNGDIIAEAYLQNQSGTNTGDETQASINALGITEVGTIATGTWNGSAIASAYLDADTAHLSGTQTFTGQKNFNSSGGTIPLNISRSGSNANQVLSIGVTDTTAEFNYIEDTDAEGTGAYGSYVFKVSGNEVTSPTTTVLTLDENQAKFAGTIYTRGAGSLTPDATQPGAIILAKGGSEASPSTDGRGIEFLTADANDGYGHRLVSFDNTNGDTPLILQRRNNNAAWTTQVTFEGNSNNTTFAGSISASEQSVFSGGITSTGESHLYKAGTNNVQTVVAVIGSDSTRPTLVFSESAATTINAGMSLEYNGQGSGDTNFMTINSVDGASKFQFTSGGDFKIGSTTVIDSSRNLTNIGTISSGALTVTGAITATGDITAYFSDERFKTKTRNIENPLEKVQALSGFMFVENELARSLGYKNDKEQVALSAQEVQAVLPEAVSLAPIDMKTNQETGEITSKSGENYLTVDYAKLVPLLVEAIKELKDEVDELKKRIK